MTLPIGQVVSKEEVRDLLFPGGGNLCSKTHTQTCTGGGVVESMHRIHSTGTDISKSIKRCSMLPYFAVRLLSCRARDYVDAEHGTLNMKTLHRALDDLSRDIEHVIYIAYR